jgi:hypothetical protein
MKTFFQYLKSAPALIGAIIKYLPVILVAFEALRQVQRAIEKVNAETLPQDAQN